MDTATIEVLTPRGAPVTLHHRLGTTDLSTIGSTFELWGRLHDEYGLGMLRPRTLLDIGGHIGTVTVAVLLDNPDCRAVVLEPLPENAELIRLNLAAAGVADRAMLVEAAIGAGATQRIGYTLARVPDAPDIHRFVGSPVADDYAGEAMTSPTATLGALLGLLGGSADLGKIDCEGCEWVALADPAAELVERWVGEYHGGPGAAGVTEAIGATHDVIAAPHDHGATGNFWAVRR